MTATAQAYFKLDEAADYLRVSIETVKRGIYAGRLRAKKSGANGGGKYLISRAALDEFFEHLEDA